MPGTHTNIFLGIIDQTTEWQKKTILLKNEMSKSTSL